MKIDLCHVCINDDFGYCALRGKKEPKVKHDKNGDLCGCSEFSVSDKMNAIYRIKGD
jgi:hypothetical protein